MKKIVTGLFLFLSSASAAQSINLTGNVADEQGRALPFASVALLNPSDSTLAFFALSEESGSFLIKNVKEGSYLVQVALPGYQTQYRKIEIPLTKGNTLPAFILQTNVVMLQDVEVTGERIPMLLRKDTVEYNAAAYKIKPDGVAEDLLKRLPGVEVDHSGNIKAQGEQVNQVLVDGKEFFGTDPQVATKNLPADAIKKVQVFDRKSDEAELTGIDDGMRSKTINLILKDNKKSAYFGEAKAGAGTASHYEASGKLYRFTKKTQFAALGMLNNINQFGFTFKDYIDFSGGIQQFMQGNGRVTIGDGNDFPIDFGKPVTGLVTSGAGGLNFTYEPKKNNRINVSYLADGADKTLQENSNSQNFTPGGSFHENMSSDVHSTQFNHRFNLNGRLKPDSSQTFITGGNLLIFSGNSEGTSSTQNYSGDTLVNDLTSATSSMSHRISGNANGTYLKRWPGQWKLFRLRLDLSGTHVLTKTEWNNLTSFFQPQEEINDLQFQHNHNDKAGFSFVSSATRSLGNSFYLVPETGGGVNYESLDRKQGIPPGESNIIDSLNADFDRVYSYVRPGGSFKKSSEKKQWSLGLQVEGGEMRNGLKGQEKINHQSLFLLPHASWENEYHSGRRFIIGYESQVNVPVASQLLPVLNNINPLEIYYGNQFLLPEYEHDIRFHWIFFDQFSFTSFFINLNGSYVHNKINWSRTIHPDLTQDITLVNVPSDYQASADFDFSTPVRRLGITVNVKAHESWERGINLVDGTENFNTNLSHELSFSIDNRKKEKWDISAGVAAQLSNAIYSVQQSLNNRYFNISCFSDIRYTLDAHWYFSISADIKNYNEKSFGGSIFVPLVSLEASRFLLKNNRLAISAKLFDLLNKNTGVDRYGSQNYLVETQSTIIQRYFLLSCKYRLNKFDDSKSGVKMQVN